MLFAVVLAALAVPASASATTASLVGTELSVAGAGTENNDVTVTWDEGANTFVVSDGGAAISPGLGCSGTGNPGTVTCADLAHLVASIAVSAGDGDDFVHVDDASIPANVTASAVQGGAGTDQLFGLRSAGASDSLTGGTGGDTLFAFAGADVLDGGDGSDLLFGDDGADTLRGGDQADELNGGAGSDTVDYSTATGPVTAAIDASAGSGAGCPGAGCEGDIIQLDVENLTGSSAGDALTGSGGANVLTGGAGADTLNGQDGADILDGGEQGDTLNGGLAGDTLNGAAGSDTLNGHDGQDALNGGGDDDLLDGGVGGDTLNGDSGTDTVTYAGRDATVTVDLATAGAGQGGVADDNKDAITAVQNVIGGSADDVLSGSGGDNVLDGGAGNDTLTGRAGADTLAGGPGEGDAASYADHAAGSGTDATITIGAGTANDGNASDENAGGQRDDVQASVENVTGGPQRDTIVGSAAANTLDGAGGDDTLQGLGGTDALTGGGGTDTTTYAERTGGVTVSLDGAANDGDADDGAADTRDNVATENVTGGGGTDTLTGDGQPNVLHGGDGADTLVGAGGPDQLLGDGGIDLANYSADGHNGVSVTLDGTGTANDGNTDDGPAGARDAVVTENVTGTSGVDSLTGDGAANTLLGLAGTDTLSGFGANDELDGGDGADNLNGGGEDDLLNGGSAPSGAADDADTITGSVGSDTVSYAGRAGGVAVSLDGVANDGAPGENDSVVQVENATGGNGEDTLSGDGSANILTGGAGSDTASYAGRSENLTLSLDGAAGNDGALCGAGESPCEGDTLHASVENVTGGSGNDTITGNASANTLAGGDGNDTIDSANATNDPDTVTCGDGTADTATADAFDAVNADCETNNSAQFPSLSVDDLTTTEGSDAATTATFTVSLSRAVGYDVIVQYATADDTATTADSDYVAASGTLTFTPGETTKTVTVSVNGDTTIEPNETFTVNLSAPQPSGVTLADPTGAATITNDDAAGSLAINDVTVTEGDNGQADATFTISRSAGSSGATSIHAASADATATTADGDYAPLADTIVNFAAGETSKTVTVKVNGDTTYEGDETFTVALSAATGGATIQRATGTATIRNDDKAPEAPALTIDDVKLAEGAAGVNNATFTVAASKASAAPITVRYATRDGSAGAGNDYHATGGTLTFAPGETAKTIAIAIRGDKAVERDEAFGVTLTDATGGATIAKALGIALIINDDVNCIVPRLKGKTLARATGALTAAHCTVGKPIKRYNAKVKRGRIVKSSPPAGMRLDQDAPVTLVVSKGRRRANR